MHNVGVSCIVGKFDLQNTLAILNVQRDMSNRVLISLLEWSSAQQGHFVHYYIRWIHVK